MFNYWQGSRQQQPPPPQLYQPPFPTQPFQPQLTPEGMLPFEMSFIENILRLNRGKVGTFYFTYENNPEWPAMVYRGRIEEAGRDHIIIYNPEQNKSYLLLMVNLDYVEFDGPIEYVPISPLTSDAQRFPYPYPTAY